MDIVIDTSALIAVIVNEPERNKVVELTSGNILIGPGSIQWEIGNAFSSMFKESRITLEDAEKGLLIFSNIPIRYVKIDFVKTLKLSKDNNIYAYDAYFLECALRYKAPILTLDKKLKLKAKKLNIETLEV